MVTKVQRRPKRWDMYTDGACSQGSAGRGPGGWAWAVREQGIFGQGGDPHTTNQRMELTAVFEGLLYLSSTAGSATVCVVTDSAYVMNCFVDKWYLGWHPLTGTKKKSGDAVANWDIWRMLIPLVQENDVTWRKVKGHSGDPGNDYVDQLAVEAKKRIQATGRLREKGYIR